MDSFQFINFNPREGVSDYAAIHLLAFIAKHNYPLKNAVKAVVLKNRGHFIFSIIINTKGGFLSSDCTVPLARCWGLSRDWQKNYIDLVFQDIEKTITGYDLDEVTDGIEPGK